MRNAEAREPKAQPADEGVTPPGQTEELRNGLMRDGWLWWPRALLWDVAAKDVKPG